MNFQRVKHHCLRIVFSIIWCLVHVFPVKVYASQNTPVIVLISPKLASQSEKIVLKWNKLIQDQNPKMQLQWHAESWIYLYLDASERTKSFWNQFLQIMSDDMHFRIQRREVPLALKQLKLQMMTSPRDEWALVMFQLIDLYTSMIYYELDDLLKAQEKLRTISNFELLSWDDLFSQFFVDWALDQVGSESLIKSQFLHLKFKNHQEQKWLEGIAPLYQGKNIWIVTEIKNQKFLMISEYTVTQQGLVWKTHKKYVYQSQKHSTESKKLPPESAKRKKSIVPWLVAGGVVVLGGIVTAVALNGSKSHSASSSEQSPETSENPSDNSGTNQSNENVPSTGTIVIPLLGKGW